MKKIVVIYWSGTGNTESMAESVVEGARNNEVEVSLMEVSTATFDDVVNADAIALGCPSMGDEVLEELEMEPFVESIADKVNDKPMVLFGSYGWGNGEWMADWEARMKEYGAKVLSEGLIINEAPDEGGREKCQKLGAVLVKAII